MARHLTNAYLNKMNSFGEFDLYSHVDPALVGFQKVPDNLLQITDLASLRPSQAPLLLVQGILLYTGTGRPRDLPCRACAAFSMASEEEQLQVIIFICVSSAGLTRTSIPGDLLLCVCLPVAMATIYTSKNPPSPPKSKIQSPSLLRLHDPLSCKTTLGVSNKSFTF